MSDRLDGFTIQHYLDNDGDFIAFFVEMPNVSACGSTIEEALAELQEAWEAMKESYRMHNQVIPLRGA